MRLLGTLGVAVVASLVVPAAAAGEILVFRTGRTMSVGAVRADGDRLLVTLRDGGDASVPASLVARIDPDEVATPVASPPTSGEPTVVAGPVTPQAVLAGRPFAALIASAAVAYGVDERLVHAVIEAESNYQPRARSRTGAKGLMQLMPATARQYAVRDPVRPAGQHRGGRPAPQGPSGPIRAAAGAGRLQRRRGCRPNLRGAATLCRNAQLRGASPPARRPIESPGATIRGRSRSNRPGPQTPVRPPDFRVTSCSTIS